MRPRHVSALSKAAETKKAHPNETGGAGFGRAGVPRPYPFCEGRGGALGGLRPAPPLENLPHNY